MREPEATAVNHRLGDKVTIMNDYYGHMFKIGTEVEIVGIGYNDYKCKDKNGYSWWCADANFTNTPT